MEKRNYTMTNTELFDDFIIDGLPPLQEEQAEEPTFTLKEELLEEIEEIEEEEN